MTQTFTLSEMADRIAELEGRDSIRVHAQLRNPAIKKLLQPVAADRGRTTAARYSPEELIRARIATVLIDIGHDAATIAEALAPLDQHVHPGFQGDKLNHPESFARTDESGKVTAYHGLFGLHSAIRGVRSHDEQWELRVRFVRKHGGERAVLSHLALASWDRDDADTLTIIDMTFGHTHLGDLTVPLAPLIAPLLADVATEA